jgi:hypothetical protein
MRSLWTCLAASSAGEEPMTIYLKVRWDHDASDDPIVLYHEGGARRGAWRFSRMADLTIRQG